MKSSHKHTPTMIPPFRHRVSLWLGLFVTCFLLWASWHSQYHCPRVNLPLGHTKGNTSTGRAIYGFREDRQTLLIYGHENLSQTPSFRVEPKRTIRLREPGFTGTDLEIRIKAAKQVGFRTLLIRDSHLIAAWLTLWIGGLIWQHRRLKRLAPPPA